ncbi:MAG: IS1634 family transposase [Caldilineaceae bacterium]
MDSKIEVINERVDDIPLLLAHQQKMGIAELINRHCKVHGNWQGGSPGAITTTWLAYILSEGDHRLNQLEAWYPKRERTVSHYVSEELVANDFRDDRLAIILKALSDDESWSSIESELTQRTIRVYDLSVEHVRLDTTTVSGHWQITESGLFQYGHSKDYRPDLPQLKVMLSSLDPLGMPLATQVVSGNRADDPLYLPAIAQVQKMLGKQWLLYTGDAKMAAITTRATIWKNQGYYLCPLSQVQMPREKLLELIQPVLDDSIELTAVMRKQADGQVVHIADAFEIELEQSATVDDELITWRERQIVTRSHKYAQSQTQSLQTRLYHAQEEIDALNERKQGKPLLTTQSQYAVAVDKILLQRKVKGLIDIHYEITSQTRHIRRYGDRPARTEVNETIHISATLNQPAIDDHLQTLGWRVYVTCAPLARLPLADAVIAYREQFTEERSFGRLKGKPLSLTPMYLAKDDHATGLVRLLSLGLRILSLLEFSLRQALEQEQSTISGLYAGNPKRTTARPTAEKILATFKDITLTVIQQPDSILYFLTPLSETQSLILRLLGFGDSLYTGLTQPISWNPAIQLHEP